MIPATLILTGVEDPDALLDDSRQIAREIRNSDAADASVVSVDGDAGERAGLVAVAGEIALSLVNAGAFAAVLDVIKGYVSRRKSAEVTLKRADGTELTIRSENLNSEEFFATLTRAEAFLSGQQ